MKILKLLALNLCLLALAAQIAPAQSLSPQGRIHKQAGALANQYIVVFKESVPQGRVAALAAQLA
ncbi:MAG TPA: hypothetical protein VE775_12040, partial [Pyrinomonadaceae bacterium]|nr:hypothetical protein [Pyrinomonadaceae bacterium]